MHTLNKSQGILPNAQVPLGVGDTHHGRCDTFDITAQDDECPGYMICPARLRACLAGGTGPNDAPHAMLAEHGRARLTDKRQNPGQAHLL